MKSNQLYILLGVLEVFIALTAIGGGIALVVGAEDSRFPEAWLEGTPFKDYSIPGLILSLIVGGSSLVAGVMVFRKHSQRALASVFAGAMMAGFIIGELILLNDDVLITGIEGFYLALGIIIAGGGGYLWRKENLPSS
jgi:hypothetical protein